MLHRKLLLVLVDLSLEVAIARDVVVVDVETDLVEEELESDLTHLVRGLLLGEFHQETENRSHPRIVLVEHLALPAPRKR